MWPACAVLPNASSRPSTTARSAWTRRTPTKWPSPSTCARAWSRPRACGHEPHEGIPMSTTPSATQGHSTNASASASATGATRNGAGKPAREASGTATGADLFSNLLSLLSAAVEPPAGAEALNDSSAAGDAQADPNANPLAALLTWPAPGSARAPTPPSGALAAQAMGGAAGKPLPSADAPAADPALQGMTLLDTPAEPDAQTLAALGRGTAGGHPPPRP